MGIPGRIARAGAAAALLLTFGGSAIANDGEPRPEDFRVFWKDSLRLETNDGRFQLRLGGRMQHDWSWSEEDRDLEQVGLKVEDGTEFRRQRIYMSGTFDENIEFKWQYDFAGGDADFKDVYAGLKEICCGFGLRVGQFKEPYSLEELTSSNDGTFLERSLANTFAPGRSVGVMAHGTGGEGDQFSFGVGFFRDTDDFGNQQADGEHSFSGRVTALVHEDEENDAFVHLGLSASHRTADTFRFRSRPEAHLTPRFADTGTIDIEDLILLGGEVAAVFGPFSLQGEYHWADVNGDTGVRDSNFYGYYVQGSWLLTGEQRRYDRKKGAFKNPKPESSFNGKGEGTGAVELAARYSMLDLEDGLILGGELGGTTLGVNWYLNNNARIMANYVRSKLEHVGRADLLLLRFQLAF